MLAQFPIYPHHTQSTTSSYGKPSTLDGFVYGTSFNWKLAFMKHIATKSVGHIVGCVRIVYCCAAWGGRNNWKAAAPRPDQSLFFLFVRLLSRICESWYFTFVVPVCREAFPLSLSPPTLFSSEHTRHTIIPTYPTSHIYGCHNMAPASLQMICFGNWYRCSISIEKICMNSNPLVSSDSETRKKKSNSNSNPFKRDSQ